MYQFLKDFYALKLIALSPPPKILKNIWFPYDWKMNILTLKKIFQLLLKFNFSALTVIFKSPAYRFTLFPKRYLYPQNGAKDIKNALTHIIKEYHLNILLNHRIKSVRFNKTIQLELTNGSVITTNELVTTSLSNLPLLYFSDEKVKLNTKKRDYIHMHLLIKDENMRRFSYDRIMGDALIHRISDMTFQVENEINKGYRLIAVGIFDTAYYENQKNDLETIIVKKLKGLKYLSSNAKCTASGINIYPSYYNDHEQLKACVEKSKGKLRLIHSTNFIYGFSNQLKRWQTLLHANTK